MRVRLHPWTSPLALALVLVGATGVRGEPSAHELYFLELVNRARADPQAEADAYLAGDLNEGLAPGTITSDPKAPLAWDDALAAAAARHTADMIANDFLAHTGSDSSTPQLRMEDAAYPFSGSWGWRENLAAHTNFSADITTASVLQLHVDLFVDSYASSRGHRINLLADTIESTGVSVQHTTAYTPLSGWPSDVLSQDFAYTSAQGPFLTGVAYADADQDDFYTPGEGLTGVAVVAYQAGTTTVAGTTSTETAGGYRLELAPGTYDVVLTGTLGVLEVPGVVLGSDNVKLDYTEDRIPTLMPPTRPLLLSLQARIEDASGESVTDAVVLTTRLYPDAASQSALWSETSPVVPDTAGVVVTDLGATTTLDPGLLDATVHVGLTVDEASGGTELAPRLELAPVPYALSARRRSLVFHRPTADQDHLVSDEDVVLVDPATTNPSVTLTLPAASGNPGRRLWLKRTTTGGHSLAVTAAGGTLDGQASLTLASDDRVLSLLSDGSDWWVLGATP